VDPKLKHYILSIFSKKDSVIYWLLEVEVAEVKVLLKPVEEAAEVLFTWLVNCFQQEITIYLLEEAEVQLHKVLIVVLRLVIL